MQTIIVNGKEFQIGNGGEMRVKQGDVLRKVAVTATKVRAEVEAALAEQATRANRAALERVTVRNIAPRPANLNIAQSLLFSLGGRAAKMVLRA